jgi:hypothetical protein
VFSAAFKKRQILRQFGAQMALAIAVPTAAVSLAWVAQPGGWLPAAACLAAVVATPLVCRLADRALERSAQRRLMRGVRDMLAKDGLAPEAWGGLVAGLAPDPLPCSYEGFMDWDIGFLVLAGDRLCFLGERARFVLTRRQITEVRVGPGAPSWWAAPRLYVAWYEEGRGPRGPYHFSIGDEPAGPAKVRDVARRLNEWLKQPDDPSPPPEPLRGLTAPHLPFVPGTPLGRSNAAGVLFTLLVLRLIPALVLCSLLGLPFGSAAAGNPTEYVLLAVGLGALGDALPYFRYRPSPPEPRVDPDRPD